MSFSDVEEKEAGVPIVISLNIGTPVQREHDGNALENSSTNLQSGHNHAHSQCHFSAGEGFQLSQR
jgi:hypothetical protein